MNTPLHVLNTSLMLSQGICTRVGDVKPLIEVACFTCDGCGFEVYQVRFAFFSLCFVLLTEFPSLSSVLRRYLVKRSTQ